MWVGEDALIVVGILILFGFDITKSFDTQTTLEDEIKYQEQGGPSEEAKNAGMSSHQPLRLLLSDQFTCLPEGDTRDGITQVISDFVTIDISGILSERLTTRYMFDHMGGLDGAYDEDWEKLELVEAYDVNIPDDKRRFTVDRRSIYAPEMEWKQYNTDEIIDKDIKLIEAGLRKWLKDLIVSSGTRVAGPGSDEALDKVLEKNVKFSGIGATLKYGLLHKCFAFPSLYTVSLPGKVMYIELYARIVDVPQEVVPSMERGQRRAFPYWHIWKAPELHFEVRAATYSDHELLMVHMPGYG